MPRRKKVVESSPLFNENPVSAPKKRVSRKRKVVEPEYPKYITNVGTARFRSLIREKCSDCIYDKTNGGSEITQISECTSYNCPLWTIRPINKKTMEKYESEKWIQSTRDKI